MRNWFGLPIDPVGPPLDRGIASIVGPRWPPRGRFDRFRADFGPPRGFAHVLGPDSDPARAESGARSRGTPALEARLERWASEPETLGLPDAERRRRRRELWLSSVVLVAIAAIAFGQQWASAPRRALPIGDSALFLFLNALNVFLIFLLVYLVARNLVKLVFERRRGALGSHLNLKFVLAFALVATVPTVVLFLVSSSIIGASIDTWFSLQIDRTLDESRQVADAYYQSASDDATFFGKRIAEQVKQRRLLREEESEALATLRPGAPERLPPRRRRGLQRHRRGDGRRGESGHPRGELLAARLGARLRGARRRPSLRASRKSSAAR